MEESLFFNMMIFNSMESRILEKWFFQQLDAGQPMEETPLVSRGKDPEFISEVARELNLDSFTAKQVIRDAMMAGVPA